MKVKRHSVIQSMGISITPEKFREKLINFRHAALFSQQEMADYIGGLSSMTISRWERGFSMPNSKMIVSRLMERKII